MDILTNPYVIIFIVVAVVVSNIMALKYTANAKFGMKDKIKPKDEQSKSGDTKTGNGDDDDQDKPSSW